MENLNNDELVPRSSDQYDIESDNESDNDGSNNDESKKSDSD